MDRKNAHREGRACVEAKGEKGVCTWPFRESVYAFIPPNSAVFCTSGVMLGGEGSKIEER